MEENRENKSSTTIILKVLLKVNVVIEIAMKKRLKSTSIQRQATKEGGLCTIQLKKNILRFVDVRINTTIQKRINSTKSSAI